MRKIIVTASIAGSLIIILNQFGFFEAWFAFILTGAIPGTSYSVPPNVMYVFAMGCMSLIIVWLIGVRVLDFFHIQTDKYLQAPIKKDRKKHLPKRRYSQI